jgi:elongation factor 1-alpha
MADSGKKHVSVVVAGHVDSGKSTTTGHLMLKLGGVTKREMEKLEEEAKTMKDQSFKFAFVTDTSKEERTRGVTINCTTKEFFTERYHYTIIDAPGHSLYVKNMISGSGSADVALLMVPADGNFTTAIAKGDRSAGEVMGQTRAHARLLFLTGIKQLIIGINKMDSDTAGYKEERYTEVKNEMARMLISVGWPKGFVEKSVVFLPMSGWIGDNLVEKSTNMTWWKGVDIPLKSGGSVHVDTLLDALDKMVTIPKRDPTLPLRIPVSGIHSIKGVGIVVTGRVEQGTVKPGDDIVFMPSDTVSKECVGKVFSIEMHHKQVAEALPGDNVGMSIKGLDKDYLPKTGDVIVLKSDKSLRPCKSFTCDVSVLDIPGELKVGYCPTGIVRTAKSAMKLKQILWRSGKDTNNVQVETPATIKSGDTARVVFEPQHPFVCEKFENCDGLGRIAILEGNGAVMLGRICDIEFVDPVVRK